MSKIVLFFGSFNPVHLGHISLAKEILRYTDNDEVWFVVSPNNPFKSSSELMSANHRIAMLQIAIGSNSRLKISDIEVLNNPDSYTSTTLKLLVQEYPTHKFSILMGEDNMVTFDNWKEPEYISKNFKIYVYPRKGDKINSLPQNHNFELLKCDYIDISATEIRKSIMENQPKNFYLPIGVYDYIKENELL